MITEKDLSQKLERSIKSPIRIGSLKDLNMDTESFIAFYKPFFNRLKDDEYLVRENQINFLKTNFSKEEKEIEKLHASFFSGKKTIDVLQPWIEKLNDVQSSAFEELSFITRQRNISSFEVGYENGEYFIERLKAAGFGQAVDDFRSMERIFEQADPACVENPLFESLLFRVLDLVRSIHDDCDKIKVTSHFMRTRTREKILGENSPEGVHEDGAQYIISALVINRENINGAESQIYEQLSPHERELIFKQELEPGSFIFQADTGEEKTFGNDLWHYVTAIEPIDTSSIGIRDIIGLDIDII